MEDTTAIVILTVFIVLMLMSLCYCTCNDELIYDSDTDSDRYNARNSDSVSSSPIDNSVSIEENRT